MERITKQSDITAVLADVVSAVVGHFDMNTLLNQIIRTTMDLLHADVCSIFLEDKEKEPGILKCVAGSGFAKEIVNHAKYHVGEGFTGTVAKTGRIYNIKSREDLEGLVENGKKVWEGRFDFKQWPSKASEFRNLLAAPLKIKDQVFGVLKVENKNIRHGASFSEGDLLVFETIANVIALTIENARLHIQIKDQAKMFTLLTAHKINNHVTYYDGIKKHLEHECQSSAPRADFILDQARKIETTTKNLKLMIEELNYYGKPIKLKKELGDINVIVKDEVWIAQPQSSINVVQNLDATIPKFYFDPLRISASIKELINNSLRAISNNKGCGKIIITTINNSNSKEYDNSGCIKVIIKDDGPGIKNISEMFVPYFTTGHKKGMGLGLTTVKENIEAHGGKISYIERPTDGACFEIILPFPGGEI